jgi:hypothetical protein
VATGLEERHQVAEDPGVASPTVATLVLAGSADEGSGDRRAVEVVAEGDEQKPSSSLVS